MSELVRCQCGSRDVRLDDWLNKSSQREHFVRCMACWMPGPTGKSDEEAVRLWNARVCDDTEAVSER